MARSWMILPALGEDLGSNYQFKRDLSNLYKMHILEPELISMEMSEHS